MRITVMSYGTLSVNIDQLNSDVTTLLNIKGDLDGFATSLPALLESIKGDIGGTAAANFDSSVESVKGAVSTLISEIDNIYTAANGVLGQAENAASALSAAI
jgi:hypothetical protein